jgi:toluene monooxygenase system protein A
MRSREQWQDLARKLDWEFSYVEERDVYPEAMSGTPWLPHEAWSAWDEPYKTTYPEYIQTQHAKEASVRTLRDAIGQVEDFHKLDRTWRSALKLHAATLPLAEFAAVVGNLRAARFGRDSAWRTMATFGALDELRHTQIPLAVMHELVRHDPQFDWTHKFFHTNEWVAIAARHMIDELMLVSNPIEFAVATNFVFETGFTNLQFIGLSARAHRVGDRMFEKTLQSIQTDEARHAQIGRPVLEIVRDHDPAYAQYLIDKWFWRSWQLFAIVTGFAMDYLTPLADRTGSFKEFVDEWVIDQFLTSLADVGLAKPWYWDQFLAARDTYHHMVYASAYTYRATLWFDMAMPGPDERRWLREKYPRHWDQIDPIWERITTRWSEVAPTAEWYTHGLTPVGFCDLCQFVLCNGTPEHNAARVIMHGEDKYILCSEPCEWIFKREPERYAHHKDVVKRILAGEAPGNLIELIQKYFGLTRQTWGKDVQGGAYPWLERKGVGG